MRNTAFDLDDECSFTTKKREKRDLQVNIAKIGEEPLLPIEAHSAENAQQFVDRLESADERNLIDDIAEANCEPCSEASTLIEEIRQDKNARLQERLTVALNRVSELERELANRSANLDQRNAELASLYIGQNQQDIDARGDCPEEHRLKELIAAVCDKMAQLESEADTATQKRLFAENEALALRVQLDAALQHSTELVEGLFDAEAAFIDRESDLQSARAKIEQIQTASNSIQEENNRLAAAIVDAERNYFCELNRQRARFESQISQMEIAAAELEQKIANPENGCDDAEAEITSAQNEIKQMQAASNLIQEENNRLAAAMAEAERNYCCELNRQRAHFESQIGQMGNAAAELEQKIAILENRCDDAEAEITSARNEIKQMQAASIAVQEEKSRLATVMTAAERRHCRDLNELRAFYENQLSRMEANAEERDVKIKDLANTLSPLLGRYSQTVSVECLERGLQSDNEIIEFTNFAPPASNRLSDRTLTFVSAAAGPINTTG